MRSFQCINCRALEPMEAPPIPGPLGQELHSKVCSECYQSWKSTEVMLINEYRLDMLDRDHRRKLHSQMREFLNLDGLRDPGSEVDMNPDEHQPEPQE